jgi:regulation of enolase protein 1 (concanavalin A-like superfamily)
MFEKRGLFTLFSTAALALALALPAAAAVLPTGFAGTAIGDGSGSVKDDNTTLTIQGAGADFADFDLDSFYFVGAPMSGNGNITARLTGATGGAEDGGERVGLMIRADADPDSAHAALYETNDNHQLTFAWRPDKAEFVDATTRQGGYGSRAFPLWLRVQREGDNFTGFFSRDGELWRSTRTESVTMGAQANAGLAVASHDDSVTMTTTWESVTVSPALQTSGLQGCGNANGVMLTWNATGGAASYNVYRGAPGIGLTSVTKAQLAQVKTGVTDPSYTDADTALQAGALQVYGVAPVAADGTEGPITIVVAGRAGPAVSPLPDYTVSVFGTHAEGDCAQGSVGALSDATTGVITLRAGGLDFWSGGEHSVFLTRPMAGNFRATVQIMDFPLGVNPCCGKAGLFVRESLDRASRYAGAALRTDGLRLQRRDQTDPTNDGEGPFILDRDQARAALQSTGLWMRVEREGDEIRTLYSTDGTNFEAIDEPFVLEGLANEVRVGLALGARDRDAPIQNRLSEAYFRNLTVGPL